MNLIKRICITLLFSTLALFAHAKPYWLDEAPDSDFFVYFKGYGISNSELESRNIAIGDALTNLSHYKNLQISTITELEQRTESTNTDFFEYDKSTKNIKLIGNGSDITGLRAVDEYHRFVNGKYYYYMLIRLPKSEEYDSMPIYKPKSLSPLVKSTVLPGWGQFSKRDDNKAYLIVASEGLSLLSALSFKIIGDNYNNKSHSNSLSYDEQHINRDNADTAYLYGNISLSIAGIIYIYNIIDALSTNDNPLFTKVNTNLHLNLSISDDHYNVVCILRF